MVEVAQHVGFAAEELQRLKRGQGVVEDVQFLDRPLRTIDGAGSGRPVPKEPEPRTPSTISPPGTRSPGR